MTRKDFELIAGVLREQFERLNQFYDEEDPTEEADAAASTLYAVAREFADRLKSTNPRFDKQRFMDRALGR